MVGDGGLSQPAGGATASSALAEPDVSKTRATNRRMEPSFQSESGMAWVLARSEVNPVRGARQAENRRPCLGAGLSDGPEKESGAGRREMSSASRFRCRLDTAERVARDGVPGQLLQ